jgi:Fe-S cluster assembly protein SufD
MTNTLDSTTRAPAAAGFLAAFDAAECAYEGPGWLAPVRKAALARFAELGLPSVRHEDWRFTNLAPLARTAFVRPGHDPRAVAADDLRPALWDASGACRLVFLNGRYAPHLSSVEALPEGVLLGSLAAALGGDAPGLESHLARIADDPADALVALNTAFLEDGAYVRLARGTVLEAPIHLVFVTVPGAAPTAVHPRVLILAGPQSQAAIVETHLGLQDGNYLSNPLTEIRAEEGAVLEHYTIQREHEDAFHLGTLRVRQERSSRVTAQGFALGGGLVRRNHDWTLAGEGAGCLLNGLYVLHRQQHTDNHLRVEHAAPHCDSREVFKGILDGHARAVFTGRIVVRAGAQKTDGKQSNMNLLLSEHAQVDTRPQLEIFANDVKCTHGATVGQLDRDALFYLRSRGIPEPAARSLLVYAFAGALLEQVRIAPLRALLRRLLLARLPAGALLESA